MGNSNTSRAYEHLRNKILKGEVSPGDSLQTVELSDEIGVSRTPIRDALRMLELDGLVTIESRTGAKVRSLTINDYKDLFEFRQTLEVFCAGLAAERSSANDLSQMREHLDVMSKLRMKATKARDPLKYLSDSAKEDSRFHLAISASSKNKIIHEELVRQHLIFRVIANRMWKSSLSPRAEVWLKRLPEIHKEHFDIYEAIEESDPQAARDRMEIHIINISTAQLFNLEREERSSFLDKIGI